MLPSTRTLLACNLLVLVTLAVIQVARPSGDAAAGDRPQIARQHTPAAAASAAEAPAQPQTLIPDSATDQAELAATTVAAKTAADGDGRPTADGALTPPQGLILMPVSSPYLGRPVYDNVVPEVASVVDEQSLRQGRTDETITRQRPEQEDESPPIAEQRTDDDVSETPADHDLSDVPADEASGEPADEASGGPADEASGEPADEAAGGPADEASGGPADEASGEPADEAAGEPADEASGAAADEASTETPDGQPEEDPAQPPAAVELPALSAAEAAVRDRARRTLAAYRRVPPSTRDHTATEMMHYCLAFGCDTEVYRGRSSRQKLNGITCLCWNYPCAGFAPLGYSDGRIAGRIGYGLQELPGQLLAVLALARVQSTYPVRVGEDARTVADLVESEKLSCRSGEDLSLKLIAMMFYEGGDATWNSDLGEDWSVSRIIKEELARPIKGVGRDETRRLMGLGYAVNRRVKSGGAIDGQFQRAGKFLEEYHGYALKIQNADGSWGAQGRSNSRSSYSQVSRLPATGRVLQWLAVSLPEDRLDDPGVQRAVDFVARTVGSRSYYSRLKSLSTRELGSVMHALHALAVYDRRFFSTRQDPPEPAGQTQRQASRTR